MREIIDFLKNHQAMKIAEYRKTGLMAGSILLVRKDGRNRHDGDAVWFVRPTWVTAGPVARLP
jgi:hypothetical protein